VITKSLMMALILAESSGNPNALSNKGAVGLTQMTEIGVKEVCIQYDLPTPQDLTDPQTNVQYGMLLLKFYYQETGSVRGALTAYNGGYRAFYAWRNKMPMPQETVDYVRRVMAWRWTLDPMFQPILPEKRNELEKIIDDVWEDFF
jgi:soluble lytic murein transglycosylase-like protein